MPLWRYSAGRYEGPTEALGAERIGSAKPDAPESVAREWVGRIRVDLERRLSKTLAWADEGETALSLQYTYQGLQAVRAYAAYQDHPVDGGFKLDGSPEDHPSLMKIYHQNAPTRYRHLIDHSDASGFYLPCEFDEPMSYREIVDVPPRSNSALSRWLAIAKFRLLCWRAGQGKALREAIDEADRSRKEYEKKLRKLQEESPWPKPKEDPLPKIPRGKSLRDWGKVGSSVRLLSELEVLKDRLGMTRDWGDLKSGESIASDGDPLDLVKYGWGVLHYVARASVEKRLPIIFDG
jgi:hypothetical protein